MGLHDGAPVSDAQLRELAAASSRHAATTHALRLLRRRLRTRREVADALRRRGLDERTTMSVLGELQRAGWIDDARFARLWVRDRLTLRPSGRRRLRFELLARGVSAPVVDDALSDALPADREGDLAVAQARQRAPRLARLPREVAARRLAAWLQRRGFSVDVIADALRTVWTERSATPDA